MSDACKEQRYEQMDTVTVLLNLAYIPDEVIKKVNFAEKGWRKVFVKAMNEYKQNWSAKHRKQWKYQDAQLEQMYNEFVDKQMLTDPFTSKQALKVWKQKVEPKK